MELRYTYCYHKLLLQNNLVDFLSLLSKVSAPGGTDKVRSHYTYIKWILYDISAKQMICNSLDQNIGLEKLSLSVYLNRIQYWSKQNQIKSFG